MSQEIELLTEIRDLLLVVAEPALAKRDEKLRDALRKIAGKSKKNGNAILLMDGSKSCAAIAKEIGIDRGNLSRLVKVLSDQLLIKPDQGHPTLLVRIQPNFFDDGGNPNE